MSYGFSFPKAGYTTDAAVKNLAWRDDQQVFLARERQTTSVTIPAGFDLNGSYYDLPVEVGVWDYYVYRSYISAVWGENSRTFLADSVQVMSFGGQEFQVQTQFYQMSETTGNLRFYFRAIGSGSLTTQTTLTLSAYICLQSLTSNDVAGGLADNGKYGIKISLPGYDVSICSPKQCSLHSEYTALKARKIGTIQIPKDTWTRVEHGFGYEPAYCGWFEGEAGTLAGLIPLGGGRDLVGGDNEDYRVYSYVTTDALYLYTTVATTVYYYLFADLAGKVNDSVPYDSLQGYGAIVTKPGYDYRTAKPHQLQFCSLYPNFKTLAEYTKDMTAIGKQKTTANIDQEATTINFSNANRYGDRGEFYICKSETVTEETWHWTQAQEPAFYIDRDSYVNNYGATITIHAEGGTFTGTYSNGSFSGDARWTGDKGGRRFQFYKGGNWNTCDAGWSQDYVAAWNNWYTWHNGDDQWVEVYSDGAPLCYFKFSESSTTTFYQEKVRFTGSSSTQFTGCTRGIDGTTARAWGTDSWIVPATMCFKIADNPLDYRPAFMAWTIGPYEADGARSLPAGDGSNNFNVVLTDGKYYFTCRRAFLGENDTWFYNSLPFVWPGVYLKTFCDEIGT